MSEYEDRRIYYLYVTLTKEMMGKMQCATMRTQDAEVAKRMYREFAEAGFYAKLSYLDSRKYDLMCTEEDMI